MPNFARSSRHIDYRIIKTFSNTALYKTSRSKPHLTVSCVDRTSTAVIVYSCISSNINRISITARDRRMHASDVHR